MDLAFQVWERYECIVSIILKGVSWMEPAIAGRGGSLLLCLALNGLYHLAGCMAMYLMGGKEGPE